MLKVLISLIAFSNLMYFQLLYCLRFYRGDDKIKIAVWELIVQNLECNENALGSGNVDDFLVEGNFMKLVSVIL